MKIHPYAEKFPLLPPEELDKMVESIRRDGLIVPILTYKDEVIDGRNRLRACELAKVQPRFQEWDGGLDHSATGLILSLNINARRHLNSAQKAALAVEALPFFEVEAAERQKASLKQYAVPKDTVRQKIDERNDSLRNYHKENAKTAIAQAAEHAGTNREYVHLLKKIKEEDPEQFERVRDGKESLAKARQSRLTEVRRTRRRGIRVNKKTPKTKSRAPSDGGQSKRQQIVTRTREAAIRCAEEARLLSDKEIAKIAGYNLTRLYGSHGSGLDYFLTLCAFIPWLNVRPDVQPDGQVLREFMVNEKLKNICDDTGYRTGQGTTVLKMVTELSKQIKRKREERQERVRRSNWDPNMTSRIELTRILDYVEEQLRLIVNPDLSIEVEERSAS